MSSQTIAIAKEARLLLGAWVAVMLMGVVSLVPVTSTIAGLNLHGMLESLVPFGAIFGIPLLATLAFGSEFQYRTMGMLLAQPVDRRQVWREKMALTVAAVAPATVVYCFALRMLESRQVEEWLWAVGVAFITTCGAAYFTFVARSTIGGLVLNLASFFTLSLILDRLAYAVQTAPRNGYQTYDRQLHNLPAWFLVAAALAIVAYGAVLTWLGRRRMILYQAIEGMQAGEAVLPGARWFPHFISDWLRCRPKGALLNLLRREFHLLRLVWMLGLICAALWAAIAAFGMFPTKYTETFVAVIGLAMIANVVVAVLAGTLSLGEEKSWGTHAWHLTLPVSASLQWAVKLLAALFTSAVWAVGVPIAIVAIGGRLGGPKHGLAVDSSYWIFVLAALLITFTAFWSACVVKGTVRATVWVIPTGLALMASVLVASWLAGLGTNTTGRRYFQSGWYFQALGWVVAAIGPIKVTYAMRMLARSLFGGDELRHIFITIVAGIALLQTHRLFAAQREETTRSAVRALVPAVLATMLCVLAVQGLQLTYMQSNSQQEQFLQETHEAILKAMPAAADHDQVERLTWNELSKDPVLSSGARRWLQDANITVVPDSAEQAGLRRYWPAPSTLWSLIPSEYAGPVAGYTAIVQMANGSECSLKFDRIRNSQAIVMQRYGGWIRGTCE